MIAGRWYITPESGVDAFPILFSSHKVTARGRVVCQQGDPRAAGHPVGMRCTASYDSIGAGGMKHQHCDCQDAAELRALFHDLGNHLVTFSCMLETVDRGPGRSQISHRQVSLMRTQTARMLDLLREAVDQDRQPENIAVRVMINEIVCMANTRRQATVILREGQERRLYTHPAALWRIVANVVDNAVRAAGPAGRVEISVHDRPPHLVIEVADNGPGFGKVRSGVASLGLGIAASLTRKCDGEIQMLPVYPHGVRVHLKFRDLTAKYATAEHQNGRA